VGAALAEIILGLDPGSLRTGFGLIAVEGDQLAHLDHGVIRINENWPLAERLKRLQEELHKVYTRFPVAFAAVEKIFFGKNADAAFKLGHARGICLLASAQHGVPLAEYAARYVKKCVTGSGSASKDHVQLVVMSTLKLRTAPLAFDASDALALAVTHARVKDVKARIEKALENSL
jgi:crossover junction endodeoxyribonuclease RuvC